MAGRVAITAQRRKHPRPRIQRAFLLWFRGEGARFAVSIRLGRRTDQSWDLTLGGGTTPALRRWLYGYGIAVEAYWQATSWDLVLCLDAAPRHTPLGYVDEMMSPDDRRLYETRAALWREELFEPFLCWVNETLAPAQRLGLWRTEKEGATWAKLLAPGDLAHPDVPRAYALLPIREEAWDHAGMS